jgi:hypothetical protein
VDEIIAAKIERAKELLHTSLHAAMATVNADGSPHNTPYYLMFSADLKYFYWGSHPESMHSQNVTRTGQAFVVIYEAQGHGGLFVRLQNAHAAKGGELKEALAAHNKHRGKAGNEPLPLQYYLDGPQKMYKADTAQFWVSSASHDAKGLIIRDIRYEVGRKDLLAPAHYTN